MLTMLILYNKVSFVNYINALTNNEQYICYSVYESLLMLVIYSSNCAGLILFSMVCCIMHILANAVNAFKIHNIFL